MKTQLLGRAAERLALTYLKNAGLTKIAKNFSCRVGEIDLIMLQKNQTQHSLIIFIEVRYRRSRSYGSAEESMTPAKRRRLVNAAERFLQINPTYRRLCARFDVIAINGTMDVEHLEWIINAFEH